MNALQLSIMHIVDEWGHRKDYPISLKYIVSTLGDGVASGDTVKYSIRALIKKGHLRKSVVRSGSASYVQLRNMQNGQ